MNLVLLGEKDFTPDRKFAELRGLRAKHIIEVHKARAGKELTAGILNGNIGKAKVFELGKDYVKLEIGDFNLHPPAPIPLTLIVSLPRPKTLKKVIHGAVSMGVKKLYFIESWKVDKSYWDSPVLTNGEIEEQCHLAMEQAKDTVMPEISFKRRFKPFAEDELPSIIKETIPLVAHPYDAIPCPSFKDGGQCLPEQVGDGQGAVIADNTAVSTEQNPPLNVTLAVGPEGGFTPYEIETFKKMGFSVISLGERILRVEFAVCALLSKLF